MVLVVAVWAAGLIGVLVAHYFWPREAPAPARADAIICLGASMSGARPGPAATRRAEACAALYAAGAAPVVVFTGDDAGPIPTAQGMAEHAMARGLPRDAALIEPRAHSTLQNAYFSLELLGERPARVILVSDAFHLPRSWMIFRAFGVRDVALYAADRGDEPGFFRTWLLRESLAIWYNAGRAVVYGVAGLLGVDAATRIGWFN